MNAVNSSATILVVVRGGDISHRPPQVDHTVGRQPEVDAGPVAGHITGARSVPAERLARELRNLPADIEVVAYCRGPYCVLADDAVRLLRRRGRTAHRLEDGFAEWRRARLPIQSLPHPKVTP